MVSLPAVLGMGNKTHLVHGTPPSLWVQKGKSRGVLFHPEDLVRVGPEIATVGCAYVRDREVWASAGGKVSWGWKGVSLVLGPLDPGVSPPFSGGKFRECRETWNRFSREVVVTSGPPPLEDLDTLLDAWDQGPGTKYGWQRHSGYDRWWFRNPLVQGLSHLQTLSFWAGKTLVGYSVMDLGSLLETGHYVIRKVHPRTARNLTLFVDLVTIETARRDFPGGQLETILLGASSGGVLDYKVKKLGKLYGINADLTGPVWFGRFTRP